MALEDLTPAVRVEGILDGADIEPATRLEYFLSKAANEVPKPAGSSDAGKVLAVNDDGDGFKLAEPKLGNVATKYVVNIRQDDVNQVYYIEKSSLDYILANAPDIIVFSGSDVFNPDGARVKNIVSNTPKNVIYTFTVPVSDAMGMIITFPGFYYDYIGNGDSIFISEAAVVDDSSLGYPDGWVSEPHEYAYNSTRNRYEYSFGL